ncbi:hypothetical protein GA0115280_109712 [Streptomyces sp. Cmuel-A718b]|nr:hypothetical protein GA0115280_109712 [Streptomyces sp. Cmuel-A718b]
MRRGPGCVVRAWLEVVVLVEGLFGRRAQPVALDEEGSGLDEAERQALGLEPEVTRPVPLLLGEGAVDDLLQEGQRGAAAETGEEDLLQVGVDAGGGLGGGGEQEGALGGGGEQFVEGRPSDLQVVDGDDGADTADEREQFVPVGAVGRGLVHDVEEGVQQVGAGAAAAVEADDPVGGQVGAVGGDGVQQRGAAGAGLAGEADAAAARQQADQALALLLALQERQLRGGRTGGHGGAPARSWSARSAGVRRTGASGPEPGGIASTSLPSTGLTVSSRSPAVSWTTRTCCGVCGPKSAPPESRDGRRWPGSPPERSWSCPYSSGARCVGSIAKSPRRVVRGRPSRPHTRPAVASGPVSAMGSLSFGGRPNPRPWHSIHEAPGCHAVQDVTFR